MRKLVIGSSAVVFVLIWLFMIYKASQDTYMQERTYACKVLSKIDNQYVTYTRNLVHSSRDFVLILSSEGKNFSLDVTPTTWATCKEGDTLIFALAPYQLDYYQVTPIRWGILVMLFPFMMLGVLVIMYLALPGDEEEE